MELTKFTISELHQKLVQREISAKELTLAFLKQIEKEDKKISAFITITKDLALSQAEKVDEIIAKNQKIPILAGIPLAVKDNILVKGVKTTCASKILENYIALYDATCIKKLKRLGAIVLGKTNLDEFAMGASTENSAFFSTKNPHDLKRVPGGSSGGSAAAVAANMCVYALGSDTGGSIRQPASFCGIVGLKPTYGAVSRYGLVAFASSLDQIGPLTKTVEDARLVFLAIKGKDPLDSTSVRFSAEKEKDFQEEILDSEIKKLRVGIPKEYFVEGLDSDVKRIINKAIKKIESLGIKTKEINLPHTRYVIPAYYLINMSEASANLARYDGIKYGLSEKEGKDLLEVYLKTRGKGFGREVKRRIMLGTFSLSAGYYEAFYLKANKVRALIVEDFKKAFEKVDFVLSPTSPTPPFKLGEKVKDPLSMYLCDIFTAPVNLAGLPAISIPAGFVKIDGKNLPIGIQIIGNYFEENKIFKIASLLEKCFQK